MPQLRATDKLNLHADLRYQRMIDAAKAKGADRVPKVGTFRSVFFALINRSDAHGRCFPAHNTIANEAEVSTKSVQRVIEISTLLGVIKTDNRPHHEAVWAGRRGRDTGYTVYYIIWPALLQYVEHMDHWSNYFSADGCKQVDRSVHVHQTSMWTNEREHMDQTKAAGGPNARAGGPSESCSKEENHENHLNQKEPPPHNNTRPGSGGRGTKSKRAKRPPEGAGLDNLSLPPPLDTPQFRTVWADWSRCTAAQWLRAGGKLSIYSCADSEPACCLES